MEHGWYYSPDHGQLCQVIEAQTLWGETTCCVWLPGRDSVVRIPASRLKPLDSASADSPENIAYVAAATRVADYAFAARRRNTERIGLPQVRNYRLNLLAQEERSFQDQLDQKAHVYPEMVPLITLRVEGNRE